MTVGSENDVLFTIKAIDNSLVSQGIIEEICANESESGLFFENAKFDAVNYGASLLFYYAAL